MSATRTVVGLVVATVTLASPDPVGAQFLQDVIKNVTGQQRAMIELSTRQLPSQEAAKEIFKLEPTIGPAKDYLTQISARCGWLDPLVLEEFKRLNGITELTADLGGRQTVKYPACIKYTPSREIVQSIGKPTVKVDKQVEDVLSAVRKLPAPQEIRATDPAAVTAILEKQLSAAIEAQKAGISTASRQEAFDKATSDLAARVVKDPGLAAATVRDGERASITTIPVSNLEKAGNSAKIASVLPSTEASFYVTSIVHPATSEASKADCEKAWQNGKASTHLNWPFDTSKVLDAFLLNASERTRRGRSLKTTPVLIADTGFDIKLFLASGETINKAVEPQLFFSADDFYAIDDERGQELGAIADQNNDGMAGNEYGFSLASSTGEIGPPQPPYAFRDHGMAVASLAIGGIQLFRYRMLRALPIRLHFANLMDTGTEPAMAKKELATLVAYAKHNDIDIINMSFESNEPIKTLRAQLEVAPRILAIVAAGNSGLNLDLDQNRRFPAMLGGQLVDKGASIITVGALREDGSVADFSNWSSSYVDVLAPGCYVSVPKRKAAEELVVEKEHGTSFAAPIVTFVAALLKAEGLQTHDVKRRIILTAEHDPKLAGKARFGAKLDAEAALAIYNDVIEERSDINGTVTMTRSKGHLERSTEIRFSGACGKRNLRRIFRMDRVGRTPDNTATTFKVFLSNPRDGVKSLEMPQNCDIADEAANIFQFYDSATLSSRRIALDRIQTMIFRER